MISEKNARKYCCEDIRNIENYDAAVKDTTQVWDIHHRGEILPCGRYSARQLMENKLYWDRPANELIFLPHGLHYSIHLKGNQFTKDIAPWNKGQTAVYSDETLSKMKASSAKTHRTEEYRLKQRVAHVGKKMPKRSKEHCSRLSNSLMGHPVGDDTRLKISESRTKSNLGRKWVTNGTDAKFVYPDEVPEGWVAGRPFKKRNGRKMVNDNV